MGVHRGLVRDWSVAQCHPNNGSHMGFSSKHMNGDPCGLPCIEKKKKKKKKLLNLDPRTRLGCILDGCHVFHELGPSISPVLLTYFPHHPESLLVVRTATSNKNGDLVFLQRALVIFNGPDNALRKDKQISFVMHKKYKYINQEE